MQRPLLAPLLHLVGCVGTLPRNDSPIFRVVCCVLPTPPFSTVPADKAFSSLYFFLGTALRTHLPCSYPLQAQLPYPVYFFLKLRVPGADSPNPFSKTVARLIEASHSIYLVASPLR